MEPGTFKSPKEHITHLHESRRTNPLWLAESNSSGNLVQASTRGVLYFNELLQNIDDAQGTEILCQQNERELVVRHNGKHFDQGNVERICSVASDAFNLKSTDPLSTGFKCIGFRSLISIANIIYIFSKGYTFRFDQTAWQKNYPWHRIPIWTELTDVPKKLHPYLDKFDTLVTFIFVLTDAATIDLQLKNFCKDPRPALFLRNIRTIRFDRGGDKGTLTLTDVAKDKEPKRRLLQYGNRTHEWFVDYVEISVPSTIRKHILDLNPTECPQHLKEDRAIKMRFAYLVQKEQLSAVEKAELFNNLPTKVRLSLPFAVDCQLLLKPEREQLMVNPWNHYLVTCIASWQFHFLSQLAATQWQYILSGLGPEKLEDKDPEITKAYAAGFQEGSEKYAFIKPLNSKGKFLTLTQCCVDTTFFYSDLADALPPECIPLKLAHPGLANFDQLFSYTRVTKWNLNNILQQLKSIYASNCTPDLHYKLLAFFMTRFGDNFNDIKSHLIVLTENNGQKPLIEVSLPAKKRIPTPPAFIIIPILDSKILALDTSGSLRMWLESNEIETLTPKRIIEKYVLPFVLGSQFTQNHTHSLVQYLFQLFQQSAIDTVELNALNNMPVLAQDGELHPVRTLYLDSAYHPQSPLDQILAGQSGLFVHPSYGEGQDKAQWRKFFLALSAKDDLDVHLLKEATVNVVTVKGEVKYFLQNAEPFVNTELLYLQDYIKYLGTQTGESGEDTRVYKRARTDYPFVNFIYFQSLSFLTKAYYLPSFAAHFWKMLNKHGKRFMDADRACQFIGGKATDKPQLKEKGKSTYLKYVLNERPIVRATDGGFYRASELLSPKFKSSGELVADIDVELDDILAEYLGFVTRLPSRKCFEILKRLMACPENLFDYRLYTTILKQIIQNYTEATHEGKQAMLQFAWAFLAENNTWQPINKLRCYAVEGIPPRYDSNSWLKNVLPVEEMIQLANLFSRPIKTEVIDTKAITGVQPSRELYLRLRNRLPFIAKSDAHHYHRSAEDVLKKLIEQFKTLAIFECTKIPLQTEDEEIEIGVPFVSIGNRFYHSGTWQQCEKDLVKHIAKQFGLKEKSKNDFKDIFTADSAEAWLANTKMKQDDLLKLKRLLDQLLPPQMLPQSALALQPPSPTSPSTPSSTSGSLGSQEPAQTPPGTPSIDRTLSKDFKGLNLDDSQTDTPPPPPPPARKLEFPSPTDTKTPPGSPSRTPTGTPDEDKRKKLLMTPAGELDLSNITITPPEGKREPSKGSKEKKSPGSGKAKRTFTYHPKDAEETEDLKKLGMRGEELIFLKLAEHFKERHKAQKIPSEPGTIALKGIHCKSGQPIEIILKWLNHAGETYKPYDLDLIKTVQGKSPRARFVEVKTTKMNRVHFYLSKNEYELMEQNAKNYRLYCVLKGDTDHPTIKKISHLKEDFDNEVYELQPIKYEVQ
ncbi:MAG: DUF3883 domain-containing protein [Parachlamydia sp.]|nr:DUF3883 domain-containing protein [Parachlamydia sp.]